MKESLLCEKFWNLCYQFKTQTNKKTNYMEYISALLYLKYYEKESKKFQELYQKREQKDIYQQIDKEINYMKEKIGDSKIFSDIQFENIIFYNKAQEKNILSIVIEIIETLSKEFSKTQIAQAYEFSIKQSAMYQDTKRTEKIFYTPQEIANVMIKMLVEKQEAEVYDPVCSSGNLLLKAVEQKDAKVFGEENNIEYYSICKTRMLLKEIKNEKVEIKNRKFDYAILNPPFSQRNWKQGIKDTKIFDEYGLSDNAVGDYAYVLRALETLKENGKMSVILPHGVLFRESEKKVRKTLIEKNEIEAIIALPENLFYETRIPVIILVIRKNRKNGKVLFIDASNEFETKKGNHVLTQPNQKKIMEVYEKKEEIEGFSRIVLKEEIKEKEFNLSIKKYIRKKSERKNIEQDQLIKQLKDLENEKIILEKKIKEILETLKA